jgi:dihydrofolate reductase
MRKPKYARIIVIAAVGRDGAIGADGRLPWRCPDDLRHFRSMTTGKVLLMGRKTADSLPRALPDRINLVLTRNGYDREGFIAVRDQRDVNMVLRRMGTRDLWVIGGGQVYHRYAPHAAVIHLTQIDMDVPDADAWFPMGVLRGYKGATAKPSTDPRIHFWTLTPNPIGTRRGHRATWQGIVGMGPDMD